MQYEGNIIRPPSEADSIILQVTTGCSHNLCTFCGAYKEKKFRVKKLEEIMQDILFAARYCKRQSRVFLADGDALILPQTYMVTILEAIRSHLPWVQKIACYANGKTIRKKCHTELRQLYTLGLRRIYTGLESGNDSVLEQIKKGETAQSMLDAGQKVRMAGIFLSVTVLLGITSKRDSVDHIDDTADLLTKMKPNQIAALAYMPLANTALGQQVEQGLFTLATPQQILTELRNLIEKIGCKTQFYANHASNYLPLSGRLPRDKKALVTFIERALNGEFSLKPDMLRAL